MHPKPENLASFPAYTKFYLITKYNQKNIDLGEHLKLIQFDASVMK